MTNGRSVSLLGRVRNYILWMTFLAAAEGCAFAQGNAASHPLNKQIATPAGASTGDGAPSFDVVSIKPNSNNTRDLGMLGYRNGTYRAEGWPLEGIISAAYLSPMMSRIVQLGGVASWVESERFDIVAKVDGDTAVRLQSATNQEREAIIQPMVQNMLADRFGLIIHRAPVEVQGYAVTVGRRGPKLEQSQPGDVVPQDFRDLPEGAKAHMISKRGYWPEVDYFHVSTAALAEQMSTMRNMLIVDQTGLKGTYNFKLLPLDGGPIAGDGSSPDNRFENAVPWDLKRLGLQLKPIKVKTETIVIDSIHRPTPN